MQIIWPIYLLLNRTQESYKIINISKV